MIDYRFIDDFLFLFVPALPKIGPFENHQNEAHLTADIGSGMRMQTTNTRRYSTSRYGEAVVGGRAQKYR